MTGINFYGEEHEQKFLHLVAKTNCSGDSERKALFYIIAGCDELFGYRNKIYDFETHMLKISRNLCGLKCMCSSSKALLKLGFQLYNSSINKVNVYDTFYCLDSNNKKIALEAIRLRFNF